MTDYYPHDPYRPMPRPIVHGPVLPINRLLRLRADLPTVEIYKRWWERMDGHVRYDMAQNVAVMSDSELAEQIMGVKRLDGATVTEIKGWVEATDLKHRQMAIALAVTAESQREKPRAAAFKALAFALGHDVAI